MTILDRIVDDTRSLIEERKRRTPTRDLESKPLFNRPRRSLSAALRQAEHAIIAECKQASPSAGVIREDFDVADLARQYQANGAAAVSILTEPLYFQGSLDDLARARDAIDRPLLRKDFLIDAYQLYEARAYGADAVLLIAAVLDRAQLYDLHQTAHALGLDCLVEIYDPRELDRIDFDQVTILGVNNRDLRTFHVDINHSLRVFAHTPAGILRVSESGLRTAQDLAHLYRNGIDAVLIGETFMRADHPGLALKTLRDEVNGILAENVKALR